HDLLARAVARVEVVQACVEAVTDHTPEGPHHDGKGRRGDLAHAVNGLRGAGVLERDEGEAPPRALGSAGKPLHKRWCCCLVRHADHVLEPLVARERVGKELRGEGRMAGEDREPGPAREALGAAHCPNQPGAWRATKPMHFALMSLSTNDLP